jgi:uncharacterized membrane protein
MTPGAQEKFLAHRESRWPVSLTICAVIAAHLALAGDLSIEPSWLLPAVQVISLIVLLAAGPIGTPQVSHLHRLRLAIPGLMSFATVFTLWYLIDALLHGANVPAVRLLADALAVWLSSAVAFSLWYWQFDAGGPLARATANAPRAPSFLFPQQISPDMTPGWRPLFGDYLYLSFTNQTAFSPTDTMPLTAWAKGLMAIQALISLVIGALVVARAVNIMAS